MCQPDRSCSRCVTRRGWRSLRSRHGGTCSRKPERVASWRASRAWSSTLDSSHQIPATARVHLAEARCFLRRNQTDVRFEAHRVVRALTGLNTPVILLKGGAYLLAGLPPGRSHFASDLDIMVPQEHLGVVERTLLDAGWRRGAVTDYDDRYYRDWMHEVPPLWHPDRLFALDLHHAILPTTSRYKPDTEALFAAAVPLDDRPLKVLCPADMVLHGAAHLFTEEFVSGLRQLADLHDLLEHFGRTDGFWDDLLKRSRLHGLGRILYYLLRYLRQVLATEIPHEVRTAAEAYRPNLVVRAIMDAAVSQPCGPPRSGRRIASRRIALWILVSAFALAENASLGPGAAHPRQDGTPRSE